MPPTLRREFLMSIGNLGPGFQSVYRAALPNSSHVQDKNVPKQFLPSTKSSPAKLPKLLTLKSLTSSIHPLENSRKITP